MWLWSEDVEVSRGLSLRNLPIQQKRLRVTFVTDRNDLNGHNQHKRRVVWLSSAIVDHV